VATTEKAAARENVADWLASCGNAWVRINAVGTPWWSDDVRALLEDGVAEGLRCFMLPKADCDAVRSLIDIAGDQISVTALVETARGLRDCFSLAEMVQVKRLAFGSVDYGVDIGA
jgi:citrate lyase subunit beta/citryl-CoA lyase